MLSIRKTIHTLTLTTAVLAGAPLVPGWMSVAMAGEARAELSVKFLDISAAA